MATSADESRAAQEAIAAAAATLAAGAWPHLDQHKLKATLPDFRALVRAAILRYVPAARTAALRFYVDQRVAAGIPGRPRLNAPPVPAREQVDKLADWAVQPLWGDSDVAAAEKRLEAAVERVVLNAGRDQILAAVEQDRQAKAWARVPEPGSCYFCALLSTRGAVYKTEKTAEFQAHDHCRCHAEPVFVAYEPSAQIREWQSVHADMKRTLGRSPSLLEWRRDFEGRPITGA